MINNYLTITVYNSSTFFSRYMAPTAVLFKLTSTTTAMNTTTTNQLSAYIANASAVISAFFRAFQDTVVGSSELPICSIISPTISTDLLS